MRRLIEDQFPIKEVSVFAAREKLIRQGHIVNLHIWWARRPLASSRATEYAALVPAPANDDELNKQRKFIIEFAKWENSTNLGYIEKARDDILAAYGGVPPRVLDPFAGGGAIPLEALRLGCETYASDLNPVAVLIEKAALEYPQKYGNTKKGLVNDRATNYFLADIRRWRDEVFLETRKELERFYPSDQNGYFPVGYIWAHVIPCQNPSCQAEIPLFRQFWLAKKKGREVALYPHVEDGELKFRVVGSDHGPIPTGFDPGQGSVSRAIATCLVCGSMVDAHATRRLFREGRSTERLVAVILSKKGVVGKKFRVATEEDRKIFDAAYDYLEEKRTELLTLWGFDPVPDEPLPPKETLGFRVQNYGILRWGDLFNARQKLALITFVEKTRQTYQKLLSRGNDADYSKAIVVNLALGISMTAAFTNILARWENTSMLIKNLYARQALPMLWDYAEVNPFSGSSGSYGTGTDYYVKAIDYCAHTFSSSANVTQASATSLPHESDYFDAVFTDPPYYDNVPYSHLSDFFYVWLKRILGDIFPELFSTQLTPKKNEIVAYSNKPGGFAEGKHFFESMLKKSFQEIYRVLKPNGIATIVYAHKSTEGWETLINSLLDSGLIVTGSWPLNTEMSSRLRAMDSAALASSIYIIARKMERVPVAFYSDVKEKLKKELGSKLKHLWTEQSEPLDLEVKKLLGREIGELDLFSGADFFIAAIGSAIEVFGKYEKVIDYEGNTVRADKLLDDTQEIVTDYAVKQILHNGFGGEITGLTRFYVLWRWNYGEAKVPFDDARKLAQSCGIDLTQEWDKGRFIQKESQFIRVLGPHLREAESMNGSHELIDILHQVSLLWGAGKRDEMIAVLDESGFGSDEAFYRVAQAISETLPNESKEKKLLEGFLAGKERIKQEIKKVSGPTTLSKWV